MDAKRITEHTDLKIGDLVIFRPSGPEATRAKYKTKDGKHNKSDTWG